ncbi:MAG: hypothetical protein IH596_11775 [Bacteroidales bacterium]|nr:hypothetical protein [Bacteroidales bacterium]
MDELDSIKLELVANQLRAGKTVQVKADGHSMNPLIIKGDLLTIEGINNEDLFPGEVVAFVRRELLFIHRIIEVGRSDGMVLTKGDNLLISDALLSPEKIIGRVITTNGRSLTAHKWVHRLFFRLYRTCLLTGNRTNLCEKGRIIQLSVSRFRFRISRVILSVYRFFVFQ